MARSIRMTRYLQFAALAIILAALCVPRLNAQATCQAGIGLTFNSSNGSIIANLGTVSFDFGAAVSPCSSALNVVTNEGPAYGAILSTASAPSVNFNFTNQGAGDVLQNLGTINVGDGASMQWTAFSGTVMILDDGIINLGAGGSGARLTLFDSATFDITGTGTLTMASANDQIVGGSESESLINGTGHTIQGEGAINYINLTNNGIINANGASALTITPSRNGILNGSTGTINVTGAGGMTVNLSTTDATNPALTNNGAINVSGTGLTIDYTNAEASFTAVVNNLNISDSSSIAVNGGGFVNASGGVTNLTGGASLYVSGPFTNNAGGTLTLTGSGNMANLGSLQNSGTLNVDTGSRIIAINWLDLDSSGNLNGGGTYNLNGGIFLYAGGEIQNLTSGVNMTLSSNGGTFSTDSIGSQVLISGDLSTSALDNLNNISSGASLTFNTIAQNTTGPLTNLGTLALNSSNMTVGTSGSATLTNYGTITLSGGSTLSVGAAGSVGNLDNANMINLSGFSEVTLALWGGSANIANTGTINLTSSGLILNGGGSGGLATLSGAGNINLNSGLILGTDGTEVLDNENNSITGYGAIGKLSFVNGENITNPGTITASGGTLTITTSPLAPVTDTNTAFGYINVNSGAALVLQVNNPSGTAFINNGTMTVSGGGSFTVQAGSAVVSTVTFHDNGQIFVGQGGSGASLTLQGSNVTFDLTGTGTLTLSGSGNDQITGSTGSETLINDVGHTIQGTGTINNLALINYGTIAASATTTNTLTVTPTGGQFANYATVETPGTASLDINLGGSTLVNNGTFSMSGSRASITTPEAFVNQSGATITMSGSGDAFIVNGLANSGTVTIGAGETFYVQGGVTAAGFANNVGVTALPTSTFDNSGTVLLNGSPGILATAGTFTNEMSGTVSLIGTGDTLTAAGLFLNSGMVEVGAGETVAANGGFTNTNTGTLSVMGGTLTTGNLFNSGALAMNGNGMLSATGTFINEPTGTVTLAGGGDTLTSTGLFTNEGGVSVGTGETLAANGGFTNNGSGMVTVAGGTLTANGELTNNNSALVTVAGGSLTATNFDNSGMVTMTDGTLTANGGFTNNSGGMVTVTGGTLTADGGFTNNGSALVTVAGGSLTATNFDNSGTVLMNGSKLTSNGVFTNEGSGTVTMSGGTFDSAGLANSGIVTIGVGGTMNINGGASAGGFVNNINSVVTVAGGKLEVNTLDNSGTILVNGAGSLESSLNFTNESSGNVMMSGTGVGLTVSGPMVNFGTITVGAGKEVRSDGGFLNGSTGVLTVTGGDLNNSGNFDNAGMVTLSGTGVMFGGGTFTNGNTGTFTMNGTGTNSVQVDSFNNAGTVTLSGRGDDLETNGLFTNSGTVGVGEGETLHANGGFTNTSSGMATVTGGSLFFGNVDNNGTITMNVGDGMISGGTFTNEMSGTVSLSGTGDTLTTAGLFTNSGTVSVGNGETLAANGGFTNNSGGTVTVSSGGSGILAASNLDNSGMITVYGSSVLSTTGTFINESTGIVNLDLGVDTLTSTGVFTNEGIVQVGSGDTLAANGGYTNNGSGQVTVGYNATLNVQGTLDNGGTVGLEGKLTADELTNESGGTITLSGAVAQVDAFNNSGTIMMNGSNATISTTGTFTNESSGMVQLTGTGSNTLTAAGLFANSGAVSIGVGGAVNANGGYMQNSGSTEGSGTIVGEVTISGGTITPGFSTGNIPGTLTVTGSFTQSGGVFNELISASANGLLNVSGNITLTSGAELDITLVGGNFDPAVGATFTLADYGTFTSGSTFTIEDLTFNDGTEKWNISYTGGDIVLTAASTGVVSVSGIWSGGSGNFTDSDAFSCPQPAGCGSLSSLNVVLNSAGNSLTLDNTSSPSSVTVNSLSVQAGTLNIANGASLTVGSSTVNGDMILLNGAGSTLNAGALTNNGTINLNGAGDALNADLSNSGAINLNGPSQTLNDTGDFNNTPSGSLAFSATSSRSTAAIAGAFNNSGSVTMAGSGDSLTTAGMFTNSGGVFVGSGETLNANGGYTNTGTSDVSGNLNTTTYQHAGGTTTVETSGTISTTNFNQTVGNVQGTGTISGAYLMSGGTITPGSGTLGVPGTLAINGSFTQTGGTFDELIGPTGSGLLDVAGTIDLDGSLSIDLLSAFTPTDLETFDIMNYAGAEMGEFTNAPTSGFMMDGWNWEIDYGGGEVILTAESESGPPTNTPEPSTLPSLAIGLLATGAFYAGRTKRGLRQNDKTTSARSLV